MSRLKTKREGNSYSVLLRLEPPETLNLNEINMFSNRPIQGFANMSVEQSGKVRYDIPNCETLFSYLDRGVGANDVLLVVSQFLDMIKRVKTHKLYLCNVILDLNTTFVRTNKEVVFLYQPVINGNYRVNLFEFLSYVFNASNLKTGSDANVLGSFYSALLKMEYFEVPEVENLLHKIAPWLKGGTTGGLSGKVKVTGMPQAGFYAMGNDNVKADSPTPPHRNVNLVKDQKEEAVNIPKPAETFIGDDEGTQLLVQEEEDMPTVLLSEDIPNAYITRVKTSEKVSINKKVFRIGTAASSDFVIKDNRTISRNHLEIRFVDGKIFVFDERSTNGTYLNGTLLDKKTMYEIHSGDKIRLSNEDFLFEE